MTVQLKFQASTGKAAIYDNNNEAAFTDPINNLGDVFFHSDLDYLSIVESVVIPFTLPLRNSGSNAWWQGGGVKVSWGFTSHAIHTALQTFDFVFGRIGGASLAGSNFIYSDGASFRSVSLSWNGQAIELFETARTVGIIPAQTVDIHLYLMKKQTADPLKPKISMLGSVDEVEFGQGKFSNKYSYIKKALTTTSDTYLYGDGKSTDFVRCGMRSVGTSGQLLNYNGYTGNWLAPNKYGVTI